jgi:hypothetical protein
MEQISIPTISSIKMLIEPLLGKLNSIELQLKNKPTQAADKRFYRNNDLKKHFGLSNNTIIKYRDTGILPFTRLGDVYLYDIAEINLILDKNRVALC